MGLRPHQRGSMRHAYVVIESSKRKLVAEFDRAGIETGIAVRYARILLALSTNREFLEAVLEHLPKLPGPDDPDGKTVNIGLLRLPKKTKREVYGTLEGVRGILKARFKSSQVFRGLIGIVSASFEVAARQEYGKLWKD